MALPASPNFKELSGDSQSAAMPAPVSRGRLSWLLTALLLISFGLTGTFRDVSVNDQEAAALWVVDDLNPVTGLAPGDSLRALRSNMGDLLDRIRADSQLPAYFALLGGWTLLAGDSVLAARVFSALCVLLAIAAVAASVRDRERRLIAALLLAAAAMYPAGTVQVYGLLLALSALALMIGMRWLSGTGWKLAVLYGFLLAIAFMTSHAALLLLPLHAGLAHVRGSLRRWLLPAGLALIVALPALFITRPDDISGWLDANQGVLLASAFFALLPAIVVWLVDWLDADMPRRFVYAAVLLLVLAGLVAGNILLRDRPDWKAEIAALNASRDPMQPIVTALDARTAPGYYDRQDEMAIRRGLGLEVGWRDHTADNLRPMLDALDAAQSVWVFMPENDAQTQTVLDILGAARSSGYREIVGDMLITRMDRPPESDG